jgi:Holliday junction DNA helicase RuvA
VIASISGQVKSVGVTNAVIEVGGVGILVNLSAKAAASLSIGKSVEIFTSLIVREDSLTLYGFNSIAAKELFETLQTVSGIGPKVSQSALSIYEPEELATAINTGDNDLLERIPGLGKKGAQRVILELKDKVVSAKAGSKKSDWRGPLESALSGLGFTAKEIDKLFAEINNEVKEGANSMSVSELLKLALQIKGRG